MDLMSDRRGKRTKLPGCTDVVTLSIGGNGLFHGEILVVSILVICISCLLYSKTSQVILLYDNACARVERKIPVSFV